MTQCVPSDRTVIHTRTGTTQIGLKPRGPNHCTTDPIVYNVQMVDLHIDK